MSSLSALTRSGVLPIRPVEEIPAPSNLVAHAVTPEAPSPRYASTIPAIAPKQPGEVMVAHYSLGNHMNPSDAPGKKDEEFTPGGEEQWTEAKSAQMAKNYARVLSSMGGGAGPDIAVLTEVEDRSRVEMIRQELVNAGAAPAGDHDPYIAHVEGPDERGIDCAVISQHPITRQTLHEVPLLGGERPTRGILEVETTVQGEQWIVLACHWPSMRGGAEADDQRLRVANFARALYQKIRSEHPDAKVLIVGDLNTAVGSPALGERGLRAATASFEQSKADFWDLVGMLPQGTGTHTHKGTWQYLDHILVDRSFLRAGGLQVVPESVTVMAEPWMLTSRGEPKRFTNPKDPSMQQPHTTGFSDHLPVVVRFHRSPGVRAHSLASAEVPTTRGVRKAIRPPPLSAFEGLENEALLRAIRAYTIDHVMLDYDRARHIMFTELDNDNGEVRDVYLHRVVRTDGIPDDGGRDRMNTEHTWPRSRGVKGGPGETDLHHLYPTDSKANSERGSLPFGDVVNAEYESPSGFKVGLDASGREVAEPPPGHKGNVARSIFYMSATYSMPISNEEEAVLRRWAELDPVDPKERQRNDQTAAAQGKHNPFVLAQLEKRIRDF